MGMSINGGTPIAGWFMGKSRIRIIGWRLGLLSWLRKPPYVPWCSMISGTMIHEGKDEGTIQQDVLFKQEFGGLAETRPNTEYHWMWIKNSCDTSMLVLTKKFIGIPITTNGDTMGIQFSLAAGHGLVLKPFVWQPVLITSEIAEIKCVYNVYIYMYMYMQWAWKHLKHS